MFPTAFDTLRPIASALELASPESPAAAPEAERVRRSVRFVEPLVERRCGIDSLLEADDVELAGLCDALNLEEWSEGTLEARRLRLEALAELTTQLPSCLSAFPTLGQWLVVATAGLTLTAPPGKDPRFSLFAELHHEALSQLSDAAVFHDHREELVAVMAMLPTAARHSPLSVCRALLQTAQLPEVWELWLASASWAEDLLKVLPAAMLWSEVSDSLPAGSGDFLEATGWARQGAIQEAQHALLNWMAKASPQQLKEQGHVLYGELAQAHLHSRAPEQALAWLSLAAPAEDPAQPQPPDRVLQVRDGHVQLASIGSAPDLEDQQWPAIRSPVPEGPAQDHWRGLVRAALQAPFERELPRLQAAERALTAASHWQESCPSAAGLAVEALAELPVEQLQALLLRARLMVVTRPSREPALTSLLQGLAQELAPVLRREWLQTRQVVAGWEDAQAKAMVGVLTELLLQGLETDQHLFSLIDKGQRLRHLTGYGWERAQGSADEAGSCSRRRWDALDEALEGYVEWHCGGIDANQLKVLQKCLVGTRQKVVEALEGTIPLRVLMGRFQALLTQLRGLGDALASLPPVLRWQMSPVCLSMGEAIAQWQLQLEGWVESLHILKQYPEDPQARHAEQRSFALLRRAGGLSVLRMRAALPLLGLPQWSGTGLLEQMAEEACAWGRELRQRRREAGVAGVRDAAELVRSPDTRLIQISIQRVYLQIITKKRGLDGALCSLALVPASQLQGGFGRIALGASTAEAVLQLWARAVHLAVERQAWYTAQAMVLRRLRGLALWSQSAMEFCRSECGPHTTSRGEPSLFCWPRLELEARAEAMNAWEVFWKGLGVAQRAQNARISGANDRVFALELLRRHTSWEERREIYGRHRRILFGGSWLAPVLRTARMAGFIELAGELEAAAYELLPQARPQEVGLFESDLTTAAATSSLTALPPEWIERFSQGALTDP
jgi:hypothetical protein